MLRGDVSDAALIERYLLLGLRLGKLVPGLVDAYYGAPELSTRVDEEQPPDPKALASEAAGLLDELDGVITEAARARWLRAQLIGLGTVASRLAGEAISYADEVERCYGVRPALVPEDAFAGAHDALEEALPGEGSVKERYQAWQESQIVSTGVLLPAVELLIAELRGRTVELVGLPEDESVELALVSDEPWLAFNYYLGDLRSRVVFNTDLPWRSTDLLLVVAHELYPGHHTEHAWKEALLLRGAGQLEESAQLIGTPQSLVSEAIATIAPEIVAGDEVETLAARLLRPLGVPYEPEIAAVVQRESETLRKVGTNAAYLLHEQGLPLDEVREYSRRWALMSDERVEKGLQFITDDTWRAYISCYTEGLRLARAFVGGDPARFRRLLTEQIVLADLSEHH
jgi:hypothetical protein